jgi:hypothetical protein
VSRTILIAVLLGIVTSLSVYAVLVAVFAVWIQPERLGGILLRNLSIATVGSVSVVLLRRRARADGPWPATVAALIAAVVAVSLFCGYGWVYSRKFLERRWRTVETHADQLRSKIGSTELELPSSRALYRIERHTSPTGETTTRIAPNEPLVGTIFAWDLLALDAVEVAQSPSGVRGGPHS